MDAANLPKSSAGAGAEMYLVPATVSTVQILATAALTWFLPSIAGRFVSGETGLSTARAVSGLANAMNSAPIALGGPRNTSPSSAVRPPVGPDSPPPPPRETVISPVHPTAPPFGGLAD